MEHRATPGTSLIRSVQRGLLALPASVQRGLAAAPGSFYLLAGMVIALSVGTPGFLTRTNLTNVGLQVAVLTILALGMTLVILTEGVDLSLGPVLSLCGVCAALLAVSGGGLAIAIPVALLVGATCGLVNGLMIATAGLPSFIVTLGMFGIAQSLATVLTGGDSVIDLPPYYRWFNERQFLAVPLQVWTVVACFALTYALLYHTRFGRYVFAIGGNRTALKLSGSPVNAYHVAVYVFAGVLAAVASFIMTARVNSAHPTVGVGMEFDAIAAVVLGGTSFEKGRGGLTGSVVGALLVGVLRNGLVLIGLGSEWQVAMIGIVIIAAVGIDSWRSLGA